MDNDGYVSYQWGYTVLTFIATTLSPVYRITFSNQTEPRTNGRTRYNFVELAPTCSWISPSGMYQSCFSVLHSERSFRRSGNVAVRASPGLSCFSLSKPRNHTPSLSGKVMYYRTSAAEYMEGTTLGNILIEQPRRQARRRCSSPEPSLPRLRRTGCWYRPSPRKVRSSSVSCYCPPRTRLARRCCCS